MSRMDFVLEEATIEQLHEAIVQKRVTCLQVVNHYINRCERYNGVATMLVTSNGDALDTKPKGTVRAGKPLSFPTSTVPLNKVLPDFKEYTDLMQRSGLPEFYKGDQNYLNAMLPMFNWGVMDYKWNSQIFYKPGTSGENRPISDYTENANFVHVQLRGADHYDMNKLKEVVNYANC